MNSAKRPLYKSPAVVACSLLVVLLGAMFWKCFLPDYVHFCNDGPLGMQKSAWLELPRSFFGLWFEINSIGWSGGASVPDADSFFGGCLAR